MTNLALIWMPLLAAALAAVWPRERSRPWLLLAGGGAHAVLSLWLLVFPPPATPNAWLAFDPLARAVLPPVSLLFAACAAYGAAYLRLRAERPNRVFVAVLLAMLGLISAAAQARHLGLLWVAIETATLATVPLLHFNGTGRAFEAAWKYLVVGGTGIALSLLGTFCLGYASLYGGGGGDLTFAGLAAQGAGLSRPWVLAAWVLLLAGYGTKMGLAPMHTWKPDAYGEAPGMVGALLAGGMTTAAFVALLRVRQVLEAAGAGEAASRSLLVLGLFSMAVAALFLIGTPDFKRMLAYSSVEHMGILSLGAALGTAGTAAALFHVWSNSLTKGTMFLSAGNLHRAAGARTIGEATGLGLTAPRSAALFLAAMLAITACPPFSPFFSELRILRAAVENGGGFTAGIFLFCLLLAFLGMSRLVLAVIEGRPRARRPEPRSGLRETAGVLLPPAALLLCSLWMGLAAPAELNEVWRAAARFLSLLP